MGQRPIKNSNEQQPPSELQKEPNLQEQYKQELYLQAYNISFPHEYAIPHSMRPLRIEDTGLRCICQQPWNIRSLNLDEQGITANGIEYLVRSKWFQMSRLSLWNRVGDNGVQMIAEAGWKQLKAINLSNNQISKKGAKIISSATWPQLSRLQLSMNCQMKTIIGLKVQGQRRLLVPSGPTCSSQDWDKTGIGSKGCKYLSGANFRQLSDLLMEHNHIGDAGVAYICRGNWPQLKILDISSNKLTAISGNHLIKANWPMLKILLLVHNSLTEEGIRSFLMSSWQKFATLRVQGNQWGDKLTSEDVVLCLQNKFGVITSIKYS